MANMTPGSSQSATIAVGRGSARSSGITPPVSCCARPPAHVRYRPFGFGLLGSMAMGALYLAIVSLAESPSHAVDLFWQDAWLVIPIIVGFGVGQSHLNCLEWFG
jgi:hypothetical protein